MVTKVGLDPIVDEKSHILILGTLPGEKSLQSQKYYANPWNHFWSIISRIYREPIGLRYGEKCSFLKTKRIAIWDVLKSAERVGSSDSKIKSEVPNDFESLFQNYTQIKAIGFNGTKAEKLFRKHVELMPYLEEAGVKMECLPSTSPTPGKYVKSLEEKMQVWKEFFLHAMQR